MIVKSKLAWKLGAVVVVILTVAISVTGYVINEIDAHYSLELSRRLLKFNSESVIKGIGQQMMSRHIERVDELIGEISRDSTVYRDIRLVSHHSGKVVASRFDEDGKALEMNDRACAICHKPGKEPSMESSGNVEIEDEVIVLDGERVLSVVAPIVNKPTCSTAACHTHAKDPPILGFLNAEYSLRELDTMATDRRRLVAVTALVSLTLGIVVVWLMFTHLLERPISGLIAGTKRIADNQLDFRFERKRNDEIGVLEESFNTMTARIRAHRAELRSAMEYLNAMVENSTDIIITVTPEGFIETFNRGAEQALGYDRIEVIGKQIESLFVDPQERREAAKLLRDAGNVQNYETRLLTKDGEVCNVMLTLSHLRDRQGNPMGTIGISKDITQEKKLQQELVQSQKFAAIGQAVTGIQHSIKNMLNALKGGAYLVRNGMAKDNRQRIEEGWAMVEEGIQRISDLALNMLNYAKEWKPEPQRVDLNELIAKLCELNRQAAAEKGVTLRFEPSGELPAVLCDPKLIDIAATDILVNAIDACQWKDYPAGECPEVVLRNSLQEGGEFVAIEIRDNGCGMTEEIRRDIFTPFFSTKKILGTGLGLALTARIINVHNGDISVESQPSHGTTFHIFLPKDGPRDRRESSDGQTGTHS